MDGREEALMCDAQSINHGMGWLCLCRICFGFSSVF